MTPTHGCDWFVFRLCYTTLHGALQSGVSSEHVQVTRLHHRVVACEDVLRRANVMHWRTQIEKKTNIKRNTGWKVSSELRISEHGFRRFLLG